LVTYPSRPSAKIGAIDRAKLGVASYSAATVIARQWAPSSLIAAVS